MPRSKGGWKGANLLDVPNDLPTDVCGNLLADPIRLSPVRARNGTPHCIAQQWWGADPCPLARPGILCRDYRRAGRFRDDRSWSYREEERFEANAVNPNWQRAAIAYNVVSRDGQRHLFTHRGSLNAGRPSANASGSTKRRTNQSFNSQCSENLELRTMRASKPTHNR